MTDAQMYCSVMDYGFILTEYLMELNMNQCSDMKCHHTLDYDSKRGIIIRPLFVRCTPTNAHGKREAHNVYAKTKEKCAELLDAMIEQVRAQIAEEKAAIKAAAESAEGQ